MASARKDQVMATPYLRDHVFRYLALSLGLPSLKGE
jgi:hypothetical protein